MRFDRKRLKRDEEQQVLPLINVVFLLLIFFMLAGRLASSDPFEVEPVRSVSEGLAERREMLVLVGADGRLAFGGEVLDEVALEAAVGERMREGRSVKEPPRIRLKADGRAQATRIVSVMEILRKAGVEKLDLLTVPEPR